MAKTRRRIAAFSLARVTGLLNSAAYARAVEEHSVLAYDKYSDNRAVNAVIATLTGEPGFAAVHQDVQAIETAQKRHFTLLLGQTGQAIGDGAPAFTAFLEQLHKDRDNRLAKVQQLFKQAAAIDQGIDHSLGTAIKVSATVSFASTVFLAVTPVGLTFFGAAAGVSAGTVATAGWVGFGYSVTKSLAKDFAEAKTADVIAFDVGKDVTKKVGDVGADKMVEHAGHMTEKQALLLEQAEAKIASLSRIAAQKVSSKKIAKLSRKIERVKVARDASTKALGKASALKIAGRSLQVVFAAHDIYEGWEDLEKAWGH